MRPAPDSVFELPRAEPASVDLAAGLVIEGPAPIAFAAARRLMMAVLGRAAPGRMRLRARAPAAELEWLTRTRHARGGEYAVVEDAFDFHAEVDGAPLASISVATASSTPARRSSVLRIDIDGCRLLTASGTVAVVPGFLGLLQARAAARRLA